MAEWFRALELYMQSRGSGFKASTLPLSGICFSVVPSSNPQSCFVNNHLVCLLPVGIFNYVTFILNICFLCFSGMPVILAKLSACIAKCMTTINKILLLLFI